jgi:hypothetical protein
VNLSCLRLHLPGAWLKARVDLGDQTAEFIPFKVIRTAVLTYFTFIGINLRISISVINTCFQRDALGWCTSVCDRRAPIYPKHHLAFALPIPPKPLTIERRRSRPVGSVRVDTSTCRELSAFEQNTGYTTRERGRGRGRGRVRRGSS